MRARLYLLTVLLLGATMMAQGCGRAATEVPTATAVTTATEVPDTEGPEPTASPEPTEAAPTEEPSPTATPEPTEAEPSPSATLQTEEPTITPEPEEPTSIPEPTSEPVGSEGEVLLEERCTGCHSLDRVEAAEKPREEWAATVDRMVGYGAQLSEDERGILIDYLVETYGP